MIYVSASGYFVHQIAHGINLQKVYASQNIYLARNSWIDQILTWFCQAFDFHDEVHHDSSVNKEWQNICYEFILNFITQGGAILLGVHILKQASYSVIVLWALLYATLHNINYNIIHPTTHRDHHLKKTTNYGIDLYDIFFNSKFDIKDIEEHNHGALNLVLLTILIVYLSSNSTN